MYLYVSSILMLYPSIHRVNFNCTVGSFILSQHNNIFYTVQVAQHYTYVQYLSKYTFQHLNNAAFDFYLCSHQLIATTKVKDIKETTLNGSLKIWVFQMRLL